MANGNIMARPESALATDIGHTTEVSWDPPEGLTYERWEIIGNTLQTVNAAVNWWIGDWLNVGEKRWGDTYTQAINVTDSSIESLKKYKAVSERIPKGIRVPGLSWTHHFYVAYKPEDERGPLLEIAKEYNLTSRGLKELADMPDEERSAVISGYMESTDARSTDYSDFLRSTAPERVDVPEKPSASPEHITESARNSQNGDLDEPLPFTDPPEYLENDEEASNFVLDFFEACGIEVVESSRSHMEFDNGLQVIATLDKGEAILLWKLP